MLKKLILTVLLLLAAVTVAQATDITLGSFTISNNHNYTGTITLRVYYTNCSSTGFLDSNAVFVPCGSPTGNWFKQVTVSLAGSTLTIPSFVLPSTDDASQNNVVANAVFFTNGTQRDFLFRNYIVTRTLGSSVTFAQLYTFNQAATLPNPQSSTYLTAPQVAALIAQSVGSLNKATDSTYGIVRLDVPAADAAQPIVPGINSPLLGGSWPSVVKSCVNYVPTAADKGKVLVFQCSSAGTKTLTLSADAGITNGYYIDVQNIGNSGLSTAANVSIALASSTLDGALNALTLLPGQGVRLFGTDGGLTWYTQRGVNSSASATYTPICAGTNDTAAFSAIIAVITTSGGTIQLPYASSPGLRCAVSDLVIPANITLDNTYGSGLKINTGKHLFLSSLNSPENKQFFFNATLGLGNVQTQSGAATTRVVPQWWGATGNGVDSDYAAIKAASDFAFGPDLTISAYKPINKLSTINVIIDSTGTYATNELAGQSIFVRYYNGFVEQALIASNTATTITLATVIDDFHCGSEVCLTLCPAGPQTFDCIAYAIGSGEHGYTYKQLNLPLYFPAGTYSLGSSTWLIRNAVGINISGAGRLATTITSSGATTFGTDGLWYSSVRGIAFARSATSAGRVLDIDGNVPSQPYTTRTVQQNTFADLQIQGASGTAANTYGVMQCRQGGSNAQCENLWINPEISSVNTAFYNTGFNALGNKILRGDMQDFVTGVYSNAGWINIDSTTMESTHPYEQATQGGFDFHTGESGVSERMLIEGVRTESLQVYKGSATQPATLLNVQQGSFSSTGFTSWTSGGNYTTQLHAVLAKSCVADASRLHAYYLSTAGIAGALEPVWPITGTIADGTNVWTEMPFFSIDTTTIVGSKQPSTITLLNSSFVGPTTIGGFTDSPVTTLTAGYIQKLGDWGINRTKNTYILDATSTNVPFTINGAPIGTVVTFKRIDASGNTATILPGTSLIDGSGATITVPSQGSISMIYIDDTIAWRTYARTWGNDAATLNGATFSAPGAIGGGTPGAITATTVVANTSLAINGGTALTTTNRTGTGNLVLSASPTLTGTVNAPNINATTAFLNNGIAQYYFVTTDFTTAASTALQLITGLTWTVPANTAMNIPFQCNFIYSQGTANDAVNFGIRDVTIAPTNISAMGTIFRSNTAFVASNLPTLTTTTAAAVMGSTPTATATNFNATMSGLIEHPSNASSSAIQIMVSTATAADAVTIRRGSFCRIN